MIIVSGVLAVFIGCSRDKTARMEGESGRNNPPVINDVTVSPSPVTVHSPITLSVRARDPDGDPVNFKYRWFVNGEEVSETGNSLSQNEFKKGDKITAIVVPSDGKVDGEEYRVDIEVTNLAPKVERIEITPDVPVAGESIRVKAVAVDPEGDPVELKFAWSVDGNLIENVNTDTLSPQYFKKGSQIVVEVIPSDGESTGVSLLSSPITIKNSPPKITSSPPTSVSGDRYTYRVIANDPDGDPVTFSLENAPDGMSIDSKTGQITWQIPPETKGEFTFTVVAEDPDGDRSFQTITISF